jgi:nitrite reductase/ring-hydroxylating ferredoxin subunit
VAGSWRPPPWATCRPAGAQGLCRQPREIAVANTSGTFTALENACTHAGGPLGDNRLKEGCYIECPWHNSVFDARTGDVVRGPARKAVKMYDTKVLDGIVYVAMD